MEEDCTRETADTCCKNALLKIKLEEVDAFDLELRKEL